MSLRGHVCHLIHELDLVNLRLLTPCPVLGMYVLPSGPTVGALFKDAALRGQCIVETICMVHTARLS